MDSLAHPWREDEYWIAKNYTGMGIWVNLYELCDLCKLAFIENKNLYIVEDNCE